MRTKRKRLDVDHEVPIILQDPAVRHVADTVVFKVPIHQENRPRPVNCVGHLSVDRVRGACTRWGSER